MMSVELVIEILDDIMMYADDFQLARYIQEHIDALKLGKF